MTARGIDLEHANRRGQTGLTGFVAFMKRPAAEKAVNELDNLNWGGSVIRVAFGNTVRLPARPIYGTSFPRWMANATDVQTLVMAVEAGRLRLKGDRDEKISPRSSQPDVLARDQPPRLDGRQLKTDGWQNSRQSRKILYVQSREQSKITGRDMKTISRRIRGQIRSMPSCLMTT